MYHSLYNKCDVYEELGKADHGVVIVYSSLSDKFKLPKSYATRVRSSTKNEKALLVMI